MVRRAPLIISAFMLIFAVQRGTHGRRGDARGLVSAAAALPAAVQVRGQTISSHPRILLDTPALARLRNAAKRKTPMLERLVATCDKAMGEWISAGYEGFDWGIAVADLALCSRATGSPRYADRAAHYLAALIDDRERVGDGKGGDAVVHHDDGYGIRARGVYAALGYDWLYGTSAMTATFRAHIVDRLSSWLNWYRQAGYQREVPIANYFLGYATAAVFTALATADEGGQDWLPFVRDELLGLRLIPGLQKLDGGDWPEGWQYGELSAAEVALIAAAWRTGTGVDLIPQIPWLGQLINHHVHALVPGSSAVYDSGDWSDHPAKPSGLAMTALTVALENSDAPKSSELAAKARWMASKGLPAFSSEPAWLAALTDREDTKEIDPHTQGKGAIPTSTLLPGTGLTLARSTWATDAVWMSFQAGPTLSDHQHNDQGHFELWRGGDALLVDGGDYNSAATVNHNSLLIDDGGRVLNYSPNQGLWGGAKITAFSDDGEILAVKGDLTEAYAPKCIEEGCAKRAARTVQRTVVFVRPATLVIDDRGKLDDPSYGLTAAFHVTKEPKPSGNRLSLTIGSSRLDLTTIFPEATKMEVRKEPAPLGPSADGPYRQNEPWGPMWRVEVATAKGSMERELVHVARASSSKSPVLTSATALIGQHMTGAHLLEASGRIVNVLFASGEGSAVLPSFGKGQELVIAGLQPNNRYRLRFERSGASCKLTLTNGSELDAGPGGQVRVRDLSCQ